MALENTTLNSDFDILIVEDELLIAHQIAGLLKPEGYTRTRIATTLEEAENAISERRPDLVFTDIGLDDGQNHNGIELGKRLHETHKIPFIYVTSYTGTSIIQQAKLTYPNAYLVKPFKKADLLVSLELARMESPAPTTDDKDYLIIKDGRGLARIAYDEILLLKAEKNYTIIQTVRRNQTIVRYVLSEVLEMLPPDRFFRIHKSFGVNADRITLVTASQVMIDSISLPVGRAYRAEIKRIFERMNAGKG